jgi:sugar lactone lactonase YvrE
MLTVRPNPTSLQIQETVIEFTGQESRFWPDGICTDVLDHILVCDDFSKAVHILDQDGQFLSLLITEQHGQYIPCSLCVDDKNNLYVGQRGTNVVKVCIYSNDSTANITCFKKVTK